MNKSDGYHIGLLIMAGLYYFAPEFLLEGRLYWLRTPLYFVKKGKTETYYFTDEEMDKARPTLTGEINRAKGLGALSAERAKKSMFDEQYQRLEQILPDEEDLILLQNLMGENVEPRRKFVYNNIDFSEIRE